MSRILTSLHGRKLGIDHQGFALSQKGFVAGEHGRQVSLPSPNRVAFFDDFITLDTNHWLATEGTDSATSAAAILSGGIGGVLRLTTGDAGTGLAADTEQITGTALQWQASNGNLVFEARVKLSAITTCYVFLGFTDTVAAALEAPIMSAASADTITTNAADAVGFVFDTRMSTDTWWIAGVANNVDATHQNTTYAPVADDYETFRIEITTAGAADFYRNGIQVGTRMSGAVTAGVDLTPHISVSKTSVAASMTMDIDYVHIAMDRAADGGAV